MSALSQHSYTAEEARELTDQIRAGMESVYHPVSYTHLTLPTIYSV